MIRVCIIYLGPKLIICGNLSFWSGTNYKETPESLMCRASHFSSERAAHPWVFDTLVQHVASFHLHMALGGADVILIFIDDQLSGAIILEPMCSV